MIKMYKTYAVDCKTVTVTEAEETVTCTDPTPHFTSGCELLLHYDADNDGIIGPVDVNGANTDHSANLITDAEHDFVTQAYFSGSINSTCPGCYKEELTPIFSVTSFTTTPSSCEEPCNIDISITWTNTGTGTGTKTLYYTVNGVKHLLGTETLEPGASVTYAATETGLSAGSHIICPDPNE